MHKSLEYVSISINLGFIAKKVTTDVSSVERKFNLQSNSTWKMKIEDKWTSKERYKIGQTDEI